MTRAFAAAAADLILEHGPLSLEDLHRLALERELTRVRTPSALMRYLDEDHYVLRPDGRYDTAARLLRGQVFTTRPRAAEHRGVLWTHRDLDALLALPRLPCDGGGEVRRGSGPVECWTGPQDWLPELSTGHLLALRWNGTTLQVTAVDSVPAGDSSAVQDVREVLARHARAKRTRSRPVECRPSLTRAVLSALVEDPALFSEPRPPLRELLPLPEDLRPQDGDADPRRVSGQVVEVPLPARVHDELARRADLLGERLPDYASLLLGAAADRVQLPRPVYDRYVPYEPSYDDGWDTDAGIMLRPDAWGR